jgi:hypothetical protein
MDNLNPEYTNYYMVKITSVNPGCQFGTLGARGFNIPQIGGGIKDARGTGGKML